MIPLRCPNCGHVYEITAENTYHKAFTQLTEEVVSICPKCKSDHRALIQSEEKFKEWKKTLEYATNDNLSSIDSFKADHHRR